MPNYAFNAKELDEENNMYYYSARYYAPPTFISRDPMFEKYPSISPYTYCANNPMKFVDPTGEDWDPVIDEEAGTITIKAIYYTANGNKEELQKALDVWNNESGYYTYTVGEGKDKKVYTIIFDLKIAEGDYPDNEAAADAYLNNKNCGYANYYQLGYPVDENGNPARGKIENGSQITVADILNIRTNAHELGHSIGLDEWNAGLMLSGGDGTYIFKKYIKTIMSSSGFGEVSNDGFLYQTEEATAKPAHNYSNTNLSKGKLRFNWINLFKQ
jgi:RHS repeat-associated protein